MTVIVSIYLGVFDILAVRALNVFGGINMSVENVRKWFMIHTYSGYEKKVKTDLEQKVETLRLRDVVTNILVPEEETTEIVRENLRRYTENFSLHMLCLKWKLQEKKMKWNKL